MCDCFFTDGTHAVKGVCDGSDEFKNVGSLPLKCGIVIRNLPILVKLAEGVGDVSKMRNFCGSWPVKGNCRALPTRSDATFILACSKIRASCFRCVGIFHLETASSMRRWKRA